MNFFGGNLKKSSSYSASRAYFYRFNHCILYSGRNHRNEKWSAFSEGGYELYVFLDLLSKLFRNSRVALCKCCGLPIIVTNERGSKRQYCNDSCKRKYKRALEFQRLVSERIDEKEAAKKASISPSTAKRILARSPF